MRYLFKRMSLPKIPNTIARLDAILSEILSENFQLYSNKAMQERTKEKKKLITTLAQSFFNHNLSLENKTEVLNLMNRQPHLFNQIRIKLDDEPSILGNEFKETLESDIKRLESNIKRETKLIEIGESFELPLVENNLDKDCSSTPENIKITNKYIEMNLLVEKNIAEIVAQLTKPADLPEEMMPLSDDQYAAYDRLATAVSHHEQPKKRENNEQAELETLKTKLETNEKAFETEFMQKDKETQIKDLEKLIRICTEHQTRLSEDIATLKKVPELNQTSRLKTLQRREKEIAAKITELRQTIIDTKKQPRKKIRLGSSPATVVLGTGFTTPNATPTSTTSQKIPDLLSLADLKEKIKTTNLYIIFDLKNKKKESKYYKITKIDTDKKEITFSDGETLKATCFNTTTRVIETQCNIDQEILSFENWNELIKADTHTPIEVPHQKGILPVKIILSNFS